MSKLPKLALEQILYAYARGELRGGVDWSDLDEAFSLADRALPGFYEKTLERLRDEIQA